MSVVPPHAFALAVMLASATRTEPRVTCVHGVIRIETDLPDEMSPVIRSTILTALGTADRYGHVRTEGGDTVWAEIDNDPPPVTTTAGTRPDREEPYRTFVAHTYTCATCLAGEPCPTAVRLGRAWRRARQ
ncbi:hypothetical protein [Streptomyces sp. NPDC056061]|uniref:hypothetical protein n=1 Tax=Streptomyces sp. NPDC056061 TaxID=3345700 RepID=UPI0035E31FC4